MLLSLLTSRPGLAAGRVEAEESETLRTWLHAKIAIPRNSGFAGDCVGRLDASGIAECWDKARAAYGLIVLFLHGCDGMNDPAIKLFVSLGYVTVAPDSFAREFRPQDCSPAANKMPIYQMRIREVDLAIKKIRGTPQLANAKIILAGFSEGARTTAIYSGNDIIGKIILGSSRNSFDKRINGIMGPKSVPVLSVKGSEDIYSARLSNKGECGDFFGSQRPHSKSVVLSGWDHEILESTQTKVEVGAFLKVFANSSFSQRHLGGSVNLTGESQGAGVK
jgi:hypothetical protein